jgi:hypothetical protein
MKKWQIILASLMALLIMVVTPLSIMAAKDKTTNIAARPNLQGALAIVAPRVVHTGAEMSLTVFLRKDQTPAADAGVWAVSKDSATTLKEDIKALREKGLDNVTVGDYEAILESNADFIANTDENGKIIHTFNENGNYLLVAVKPGYVPAFSPLAVRNVLAITGPKRAAPGEEVTFSVTQKATEEAISGAGVWAVTKENAKALRAALKEERKANKGDLQNADWAGILDAQATSLGTTDANGEVTYTFDSEGKYLLITALEGYVPGFSGIAIAAPKPSPSPSALKVK